jgi:hypothetical protein
MGSKTWEGKLPGMKFRAMKYWWIAFNQEQREPNGMYS